jgi:hypothetical protein
MNLCDLFTNFHDGVKLQTINGKIRPCYFDGVDLIPLEPTDTQCEFSYTRQIGESTSQVRDFGGCSNDYEYIDRFRFVHFAKGHKNKEKLLKRFRQYTTDGIITIESINSNANENYKSEIGQDKLLEFKDFSYIIITFTKQYLLNYDCNECE